MNQNKKAIVLGGTFPHIELLNILRKSGFYTILVDYLPKPPAKHFADKHILASTLDPDAVLAIASEQKVDLVISSCVDQANVTAVYVGERLGLPIPYSSETAMEIANKSTMKKGLLDFGIRTAEYVNISSSEANYVDLINTKGLRFPLIVKPVDGNGSKGVMRVYQEDSLEQAIEKSRSVARNGDLILEEFITGREIAADCYVDENDFQLVMTRERVKKTNGKSMDEFEQISGSFWPAQLNDTEITDFKNQVEKIISAFELKNVNLIVQAILQEGEFYILEFSPRIGGGDNYDIIQKKTGCNLVEVSLNTYLGKKNTLRVVKDNWVHFDFYFYGKKGIFGDLEIPKHLKTHINVVHIKTYKNRNDALHGNLTSSDRVGVILLRGRSQKEVTDLVEIVRENVRVLDVEGKDITLY